MPRPSIKVDELLRDEKVQELFHFYHDALKQVRVRVRVCAYATLIWLWRHVSVAKGQPCLTCYHDALEQVGTPIAAQAIAFDETQMVLRAAGSLSYTACNYLIQQRVHPPTSSSSCSTSTPSSRATPPTVTSTSCAADCSIGNLRTRTCGAHARRSMSGRGGRCPSTRRSGGWVGVGGEGGTGGGRD